MSRPAPYTVPTARPTACRSIVTVGPLDFLSRTRHSEPRLRPTDIVGGTLAAQAIERGTARPLAGSALAFSAVELLARTPDGVIRTVAALTTLLSALEDQSDRRGAVEAVLQRISAPRPAWAGFALDRPLIMGILNVTPDSFSDGGHFLDRARAVAHGRALLAGGADIIDVGGESTRPGATPVTLEEEGARIEPVIRELADAGATISVDTRHPAVMARALAAGARIMNDISALADPAGLALATKARAPVVLMHMQGEPRTMQHAPAYELAPLDVLEFLETRITACTGAGLARANIVVDPGIGFGKTKAHNFEILARIALFHSLGTGVLLGASRKSFLGGVVESRLAGSLATAVHAVEHGVQVLRVHDVAETRAAIDVIAALTSAC
jgi:dihydropteroate synthase